MTVVKEATPPLAATEPLAAASRFGQRVTASRMAFRQHFDAWLAEGRAAGRAFRPTSFLHAQFLGRRAGYAGTGPHDTAGAVALCLLALEEPSTMSELAIAVVAAGLCDQLQSVSSLEDRLAHRRELSREINGLFGRGEAVAEFAVELERAANLEAMSDADGTWSDPDALGPAMLLARRRLCRIETVDAKLKKVTGTGFLIGPSAVLTNWHVVSDLPSVLAAEPTAEIPLWVRFDYGRSSKLPDGARSVFRASKDWLIASSETGALAPHGRQPDDGWWQDSALRSAWRQGMAGNLDFAVLRVIGAPGLLRGWYDLASAAAVPPTGSCFALHHPNGNGRTFTAGSFALPNLTLGARAFHTASTAHGSSGGLIYDDTGRPVALHYLGIGAEDVLSNPKLKVKEDVVNVAIPLTAIAQALAGVASEIARIEGLTPPRGCLDGRRPVFGREQLLKDLVQLLPETAGTGAPAGPASPRVLVVRTPSGSTARKPGKSFTVDILEALLGGPKTHVIRISADQVRAGAEAMARLLLSALPPGEDIELPEQATTEGAYDQVLVDALRTAIADRWPDGVVWLIIDDLDVHTLTDDGGRRFLSTLYRRVRDIPQLRIALIGLGVSLDSIAPDDLIESPLDPPEKLRDLFRDWLMARSSKGAQIPDEVLDMIADSLASFAGSDAPLATLSQFTADHLLDALDKRLGAA